LLCPLSYGDSVGASVYAPNLNVGPVADEGGEVPPKAVEVSVRYNVAWNAMICETAEDNGFTCADISTAFNGEDGRTPSGELLAPDYIHPSDKGHERIAQVLVDLSFAPLVP
jgi:hypothetical protein